MRTTPPARSASAAARVRLGVLKSADQLWRADDFRSLSATAVMTELSRLTRTGELRRVAKGVYYRPGRWSMGETKAKSTAVASRAVRADVRPAGLSAANALGLTTQNPAKPEVAIAATKPPVALRGRAFVRVARPARKGLSQREAALLEVLRDRARTSDLSVNETVERLTMVIRDRDAWARLLAAAADEPPRVRAMLGALGELAGTARPKELDKLRRTLNPVSRFDFGALSTIPTARDWQAKRAKNEADRARRL